MGAAAAGSGTSFARNAAVLADRLRRTGVRVADMRSAPALELQFAGLGGQTMTSTTARPPVQPLEGRIESRPVTQAPAASTGIRYFLDGAQRTLPFVRIGTVPVSAVVAAAGIVEREPCAGCAPARGTIRMQHAWIVPESLENPDLRRFVAEVRSLGMEVIDPLALKSVADPEAEARDYGQMQIRAWDAARVVRERLEETVLAAFRGANDEERADGWLVVDGRLRRSRPKTLGLVKQFADPLLSGPDAEMLLGLAQGNRTTAFRRSAAKRGDGAADQLALWYLRLWDHDRLDARHALVRVEAPDNVRSTAQIDEISGWLLAERTPRATGDERWATLLYPVHQLERILKRRIDGDTRGWGR